jgi:hypothetical protein
MARASIGTQWLFSLTPALSRWERENVRQRRAEDDAPGDTMGGRGGPLSQRERLREGVLKVRQHRD